MNCLNECEFQEFKEGKFHCGYYNSDLVYMVKDMDDDIKIIRCDSCINEGMIGKNSVQERAKKIKYRIGLMMDSFYSFKDDIESEVTEIYRILKDLENED